jgi:excisionase family DNA binding protein
LRSFEHLKVLSSVLVHIDRVGTKIADDLKIKPRTIYEIVAQGRIPFRKPSGIRILRFDLEEIMAWRRP